MKRGLVAGLALMLAAQACGQTPTEFRPLPSALGDIRGVALGFNGLLPLLEGEGTYAAWINLERGQTVRLGAFYVNDSGQPTTSDGTVIDRFPSGVNLFKSVSIFITIEPGTAVGSSPGAAVILQGPFIDGVAHLTVPAPLGIRDVQGSYRVFTPTDGPGTNEGSGIWAVSTDGKPLLQLPATNSVYAYEHYLIIDGKTLTLGRFNNPNAADFANPYAGSEPAPAFPGEDFVANPPEGLSFPLDLAGARLLVTLEPIFDDTADPSQLVLLDAILPAGLKGGEIIQLTSHSAEFPTGTAAVF